MDGRRFRPSQTTETPADLAFHQTSARSTRPKQPHVPAHTHTHTRLGHGDAQAEPPCILMHARVHERTPMRPHASARETAYLGPTADRTRAYAQTTPQDAPHYAPTLARRVRSGHGRRPPRTQNTAPYAGLHNASQTDKKKAGPHRVPPILTSAPTQSSPQSSPLACEASPQSLATCPHPRH